MEGAGVGNTEYTIFDNVFRTMLEKVPEVVIPLINEMFRRDYPLDEPFVPYRNEHETPRGLIATDSFFKIRGRYYHIECQSTADSTMAVRMIEYDFAIAVEESLRSGAPYRMRLPSSGVLYLRDAPSARNGLNIEVELPDEGVFTYHVRTLFAQQYGCEEIFAKRLLVLLPFYIMRYERMFNSIAENEERTEELLAECRTLRLELERIAVSEDNADLYRRIVELVVRVSDYLLKRQEGLRKEVRESMGGEVLDLVVDKIIAAEHEAREKGLKEGLREGREKGLKEGLREGREKGRAEGRAEGRKEAREELAARLRERGMTETEIQELLASK